MSLLIIGVLRKKGKRRKGGSPRANQKVQSLIMVHRKIGGGAMFKMMMKKKSLWNKYMMPIKTASTKKMRKLGSLSNSKPKDALPVKMFLPIFNP